MLDLCRIIFGIVVDLFRPRAALEAEILVLRQQIIVLRRGRPSRVPFLAVDRMVLGWVCQLFPKTQAALAIVRPDTVVRWRRDCASCLWLVRFEIPLQKLVQSRLRVGSQPNTHRRNRAPDRLNCSNCALISCIPEQGRVLAFGLGAMSDLSP
jgi:hypothetical protein